MKSSQKLLSQAWQIYTARWQTLVAITLVPWIVYIPMEMLSTKYASDSIDYVPSIESIAVMVPAFIILGVLSFLLSVLMGIALIYTISTEHTPTVREAYGFAKQNFLSYIWISILVGIVTVVGFLLLIIPGIIFSVWFAFSLMVLIFEHKKGTEALKASREYVRGRWWSVFVKLIFLTVIVMLISLAIGFVIGLVSVSTGAPLIASIVSHLGNLVIVPISVAYTYFLYTDLRRTQSLNTTNSSFNEETQTSDQTAASSTEQTTETNAS